MSPSMASGLRHFEQLKCAAIGDCLWSLYSSYRGCSMAKEVRPARVKLCAVLSSLVKLQWRSVLIVTSPSIHVMIGRVRFRHGAFEANSS